MNDLVVKKSGLPPTKQNYKRVCYKANPTGEESAAMGFSVRITETETGNNLFPQWCPLRNREQKQNQFKFLVAPRGRRMPKLTPQKKI